MNPIRLRRPGQPEPLHQTAVAWVLKTEDGGLSSADENRLRDWLEDPLHARAFNDALWALDATQRHSGSPELMAMREAALSRRSEVSSRHSGVILGLASAMAAASLVAWLTIGQPWGSPLNVPVANELGNHPVARTSEQAGYYRTGVGERSAVILPDGSVATLDTDSQLRIAYSTAERGVYLIKGQALFEVAKGRVLPFQVYAAGQRITAVGTVFDVRIDGAKVQVSMAEGVVKVRSIVAAKTDTRPREVTLRAGEALTSDPSRPAVVTPVASSQVATWRGGLLVFEDENLGDAVAEINRYTDKPIKIADASIRQYRVTGVFKTRDPDHFATAMSEVFPIQVRRDAAGSAVLHSLH